MGEGQAWPLHEGKMWICSVQFDSNHATAVQRYRRPQPVVGCQERLGYFLPWAYFLEVLQDQILSSLLAVSEEWWWWLSWAQSPVAIAPFASSERNEISFPPASFNHCGKANQKKVISGLFHEILKQRRGPKLSFGFTTWERLDRQWEADRQEGAFHKRALIEASHQPSVGYSHRCRSLRIDADDTYDAMLCSVYHIEVRTQCLQPGLGSDTIIQA